MLAEAVRAIPTTSGRANGRSGRPDRAAIPSMTPPVLNRSCRTGNNRDVRRYGGASYRNQRKRENENEESKD
jgi:hypothetical protein